MAKQSITVELDDETIRYLAVLGKPIEVLAQLAYSAAHNVRPPGLHAQRAQTNRSLRDERNRADVAIAENRNTIEEEADEWVRTACQLADREHKGAEQRHHMDNFLAVARQATDKYLTDERIQADSVLVGQREANEQMVRATIRAQELTDEADAGKARAENIERELRAVAELREMFIGILGHDLRNPLGSIGISAALLLRRGHLDEQDAATAARIIRSSQRMKRMIGQLLDLTRARLGGGIPIEPKPTDLREVCRNVVEEFEATIQLEVEGDVTGIWDQDRLAEVLSNLAGNAMEYGASGTGVIVKAHADGAEVVVEISNRGDPIPADVLPFIFEPFHRANQREHSATGNLGLGLYIAKQIVLSHGGTLDARSSSGTTTFVMRLPSAYLAARPVRATVP